MGKFEEFDLDISMASGGNAGSTRDTSTIVIESLIIISTRAFLKSKK